MLELTHGRFRAKPQQFLEMKAQEERCTPKARSASDKKHDTLIFVAHNLIIGSDECQL